MVLSDFGSFVSPPPSHFTDEETRFPRIEELRLGVYSWHFPTAFLRFRGRLCPTTEAPSKPEQWGWRGHAWVGSPASEGEETEDGTWAGCLPQVKTFLSRAPCQFLWDESLKSHTLSFSASSSKQWAKPHVCKWSLSYELRDTPHPPMSSFLVCQLVYMEALVSQSNINWILSHAHNFGIREFWLQKPWSWQDSCSNSNKSLFMCLGRASSIYISFHTLPMLLMKWKVKFEEMRKKFTGHL